MATRRPKGRNTVAVRLADRAREAAGANLDEEAAAYDRLTREHRHAQVVEPPVVIIDGAACTLTLEEYRRRVADQ